MTQQEFEERTGMKVCEAYYRGVIERQYLRSNAGDKDTFCHWWRETHKGMTERLMEQVAKDVLPVLDELREEQEKLDKTYERLYKICVEDSYSRELREMCVEHYGWRNYLRHKLTDREELEDDEMDRLVEMLDNTAK